MAAVATRVADETESYVNKYQVINKGLQLFVNIGKIATAALAALKLSFVATAVKNLVGMFAITRDTINNLDFVSDACGLVRNVTTWTKEVILEAIFNSCFFIADVIGPVLYLAEAGLYALGEVVKKGLGMAAGAFCIVGFTFSVANSSYEIHHNRNVGSNICRIIESVTGAVAAAVGFVSAAVFPVGWIVVAAFWACSAGTALVRMAVCQ